MRKKSVSYVCLILRQLGGRWPNQNMDSTHVVLPDVNGENFPWLVVRALAHIAVSVKTEHL